MRRRDFELAAKAVKEQAGAAAARILASCPDEELDPDLRRRRQLIVDRAIRFNRIEHSGSHTGFYLDDEPVAVVVRGKTSYDIYHNRRAT